MGIVGEEPVLSRLDRLDNMVRQLEEMRECNCNRSSPRSRSSCASSTPSSGTLTSTEGHPSSVDFSPQSLEKHCRPIDHVMVETQVKGTLIERLDQVEDRLLKLCVQLEEELEEEKKREATNVEKKAQKKGIKQFVKQCVSVKGQRKGKAKSRDLKTS